MYMFVGRIDEYHATALCCDLIGFRYLNNISDTTLLSAASFTMRLDCPQKLDRSACY